MDKKSFEKLIELQGDRIYGFCRHLCADREEADELYQETMLRAFELRARIDTGSGSATDMTRAGNYVIGISVKVRKELLKQKKKRGEEISLDETYPLEDTFICGPEEEILRREQKERIRMAVKRLPEKLGVIAHMYYYAGMSTEEIAEQLGIPRGTVKSRLSTVRETLRRQLEE